MIKRPPAYLYFGLVLSAVSLILISSNMEHSRSTPFDAAGPVSSDAGYSESDMGQNIFSQDSRSRRVYSVISSDGRIQAPDTDEETKVTGEADASERVNKPNDILIPTNSGIRDAYFNSEWMSLTFKERQDRFLRESRDSDWADSMEQRITAVVASWDHPPVQLLAAECRVSMCSIATYWPPNPPMPQVGQQVGELYALGLDHQGDTYDLEEGLGHLKIIIARRR